MSKVIARIRAAMESDESLNWRQLRDEIHNEHEQATSEPDRAQLLAVYTALMDWVERNIGAEDLPKFRETRRQDYNLLVIREAVIGENICTETLDAVTKREVDAGRMSPDDELRVAAINGMTEPHYSRAELIAIASAKQSSQSSVGNSSSWRHLFSKFFGD